MDEDHCTYAEHLEGYIFRASLFKELNCKVSFNGFVNVQEHKKDWTAQCTCTQTCIHPFVFTKYVEDSYGKALKLA